jgi:hypothetical protein
MLFIASQEKYKNKINSLRRKFLMVFLRGSLWLLCDALCNNVIKITQSYTEDAQRCTEAW